MTLAEYLSKRGAQSKLARSLKITPVLIHQWSTGKRQVPAERCRKIEQATSGQVTAAELRPDVFGPADTAAA